VAISLKHVKMEKKLLYGGPIGTHKRSFERYHLRPLTVSCSPRLGVVTPPKTPITITSGTGKATDFKFGWYNRDKSALKILKKTEHGRIQGLPKVFKYPLLSQERVKLPNSNFVRTFIVSVGTKAH